MPQVLIVSNRLPVSVAKVNGKLNFSASVGGVATGLASYLEDSANQWIGWPGIANDDLTDDDREIIIAELQKRSCIPVFLSQQEIDDFYSGFSNSILWPALHSMKLKLPDESLVKQWWRSYKQVNKLFAEEITNHAANAGTVWVHDYHFMLLPELLKSYLPNSQIGYFLHTPYPPFKVFKKLLHGKTLMKGVLGSDLIGLQTEQDASQFADAAERYEFGTVEDGILQFRHHAVQITNFPISIDYEKFVSARELPAVQQAAREFRKKYRGLKIITGVDRLDITKGFIERLEAYREFLERNPRQRGKVIFALVGAPSRGDIAAYKRLSERVSALVNEINTTYGRRNWQPVDYNNKGLPFESVSALFQIADVGFVTPLRDGMNLVAKEFIASKKQSGVLILSTTAGAAAELQDAVLVDVNKPESMVAALEKSLSMHKTDIVRRFKGMRKQIAGHTIHDWSMEFIEALQRPLPIPTRLLGVRAHKRIKTAYDTANKRALFIDYDGVMAELVDYPEDAMPTLQRLGLLKQLADDPKNDVIIVSGRDRKTLNDWLGNDFTLAAEHGAFRRAKGETEWESKLTETPVWKRALKPILAQYAAMTPGANVEEKDTALVWHYRQSPAYTSQKNLVLLKKVLKPLLKDYGLRAYDGRKILEVKPRNIHKGTVAKDFLRADDYDFILAAGDDYTDEHMFKALPDWAVTVKVGSGLTDAKYRTKDVTSFVKFLRTLAR
jgi:trehalose 6-phosphate synthase/phosphatase